jgi:hypothetical protein
LAPESAGAAPQALNAGSILGCLDRNIGETVEGACEKTLFAGPETVAAATAYLAARLSLQAKEARNGAQSQRGSQDCFFHCLRKLNMTDSDLEQYCFSTPSSYTGSRERLFFLRPF